MFLSNSIPFLILVLTIIQYGAGHHGHEEHGDLIRERREVESCSNSTFDDDTQYCCHEFEEDGEVLCCDGDIKQKPNCSDGKYVFYPNECYCLKFFNCYQTKRNDFKCPDGGYWTSNSSQSACLEIYRRARKMRDICESRKYEIIRRTAKFVSVTFTIRDSTQDPPVDLLTFTDSFLRAPLYNIMLYFAGKRDDFSFESGYSSVYWRRTPCINGLCGDYWNDQTWWQITDGGVSIPVGTSKYMPDNNAKIMFNFIKEALHSWPNTTN